MQDLTTVKHNMNFCLFIYNTRFSPLISYLFYPFFLILNLILQNGWTPLHCAAYWNKPDVVKCLLKNSADVSIQNKVGVVMDPSLVSVETGIDSLHSEQGVCGNGHRSLSSVFRNWDRLLVFRTCVCGNIQGSRSNVC